MKTLKTMLISTIAVAIVILVAGCASTESSVTAPVAKVETPRAEVTVGGGQVHTGSGMQPQVLKLVDIGSSAPEIVNEGETFANTIKVTARDSVAWVVIRMMIPDGLEYVKSEPEATPNGNILTWKYPSMDANETRAVTVHLKPVKQGSYKPCVSVEAVPQFCYVVKVVKPKITITKTGPAQAMLNEIVNYTVVVKNEGDGMAKDVIVHDTIPEGLAHESGKTKLELKLGNLGPQQEKVLTIPLKAVARGEHCNQAQVVTANAGESKDEACTLVQIEDFTVEKTGMEEQYLNKNADYTITVKNVGDTTLNSVRVTDTAAPETKVVEAPGAVAVTSTTASWVIDTLKPGAEESFELLLTSHTPGTHRNAVSVNANGKVKSDDTDTLWKGRGAVLLEVIDTDDPLQDEEETTYIIRVTNQGTAEDTNIEIWAEFPREIVPISASGEVGGNVDGAKVVFEPYDILQPKQSITYKILAKGKEPGDGRIKVYLKTDLLETPVVEEESTHVY